MKNHLGSYECKLCLTLHNNEVGLSAAPAPRVPPPVPSCALPSPSRRLPPCPRVPIHLTRMQNAAEAEGHRLGPAPTPDRALECVSLRETLVTPDEATTALDLPLGHLPSAPRCRTSASPGRSLQRSAPGRDVELCGSLYVV